MNSKNIGKYGYTLIEVLLVMALFAVLLSICLPSANIISIIEEKKELDIFIKDINYTRNSAIIDKSSYIIHIDQVNNGYKIEKSDGKEKKIIKSVNFSKGNILKYNNFKNALIFNYSGSPSAAGTIQLSNRKKQKIEITITPVTGKVNVYKAKWRD